MSFSTLFTWLTVATAACGLTAQGVAAVGSASEADGSAAEADGAASDAAAIVYQNKCAACHGADGQGEAGAFEAPLAGDLSIDELARVIERTMPEGSPEDCVGDEARAVASYLHGKFYSPAARARGENAPRIALSRLTAAQHRSALSDLVGRFTPPGGAPGAPGWKAAYYKSDGMNKTVGKPVERTDASIDFNFAAGAPAEGIGADQFSMVWRGAVSPPYTGEYEFRLRTENGARLYLNRDGLDQGGIMRDDSGGPGSTPLIDQWVGSGKMREGTARVYLLAGRRYPVRMEFFKYLDKTASVRLEWRTPHGDWALLDSGAVDSATPQRVYVPQTPLPADDRSLGYERGTSVSQAWLTATSAAALETADEVVARLELLAGKDPAGAADFLGRFVAAAYRRPLTPEERRLFEQELFATTENTDGAVRKGVLLALTSPHFLYADLTGADQAPGPHTVASRLALTLWDSIPGAELAAAADKGEPQTPSQVRAQAERMLSDPRTRVKVQEFFADWLELDERNLSKDQKLFPEFDAGVAADLRRSLELFLSNTVWEGDSDYRQLLLADYLLLNDRLAALYGAGGIAEVGAEASVDASTDQTAKAPPGGFRRYVFAEAQRSGVLTHPYLLSAFAYHNNTSPIHRGVFLTRRIVGRTLRPPPVAVAFSDDSFAADLTMREKVTELTRDQACMSCHEVINPLGFALEHFDAVGRYRQDDGVKPIDSRSMYTAADGATLEVSRARDIAAYAAGSAAAHRAFIKHLFHHLAKQDPSAYGPETAESLRRVFTDGGFNVRKIIVEIAVVAAGHGVAAQPSAVQETSL